MNPETPDLARLRTHVLVGALTLLVAGLLVGCASPDHYDPVKRREKLLVLYPPGKTTRADVTARWGDQPATTTAKRPAAGWAAYEFPGIAERCLASEKRTGKRVDSCERRLGTDGMFALCYCWFYYDRQDRIVDVEWQWSSD
jgi:hypothetical protein